MEEVIKSKYQTYIALLRGINVGGHRKILMSELKLLLSKLAFQNVRTYIQSGNIIFDSRIEDELVLANNIANLIMSSYGFEVPTLVLRPEKMKSIIDLCPFKEPELSHSYFTIFHSAPQAQQITKLSEQVFPNETYFVTDTVAYSYPKYGAGKAKANNNYFEKNLQVIATSRNSKTMIKLLEMTS